MHSQNSVKLLTHITLMSKSKQTHNTAKCENMEIEVKYQKLIDKWNWDI